MEKWTQIDGCGAREFAVSSWFYHVSALGWLRSARGGCLTNNEQPAFFYTNENRQTGIERHLNTGYCRR